MQLSRALELLVLGLSAASVTEATFVGVNVAGRDAKGIQQRQLDGVDAKDTGATSTADTAEQTSSSAPAESTSKSEPSSSSSSSTKPPAVTTSSDTPAPSSSSSKPSPSSSSKDAPQTTSHQSSPTSSAGDSQSTIVSTIIQVVTSTRSDGSPVTYTSETKTTQTAGLVDSGSNGNQSSGMSTTTRNTVIGVVVGVGGAIILGGLALVAWRIWGRKKHQEEHDGLMDYGSAIESKPDTGGSMAGRTPFQSTLESYHAPTQVNTAANF